MACNCGGTKAATTYVYTAQNGQKTEYRTEVEARAAQIRDARKGLQGTYKAK
jgi:hypothetical protein